MVVSSLRTVCPIRRGSSASPRMASRIARMFMVAKDCLEANPIGVLDDMALRDVVKAIGHVIDSDCEPN